MIRVSVSLANASVTETETLTAGRVGLECAFTFSSEWDDLAKVAVFEGAETIEVALGTASVAVVPPECMATAGYNLRVGVYGLSASTAIVIPTIWAKAGKIKDSAAPDDESLAPATPELVAQIIEKSDTALMLAQNVAEQAASGAFIGEPGVSPTISSTVIENGHRLTITDVNGETEVDVMNGTDGRDGTDGTNGTDGSDGVSPEVTITTITGGHRVTITDADHPTGQSFDVMDGEDGEGEGLSNDVKQALLQLARKVAYIDANGQDYYQDLYDALYPPTPIELTGITATFTQGTHTIFDTDSLDDLKPYLTVTANYSDSSSATVIDYTLSGTLTAGTSTITASYQGKTATFTVAVTHKPVMTGITATFNQGSATIYDTDSLDSLKSDLVVTATYSDSTTATVPSSDYTLSGTLTEGTSTITVSYGGKTTTFNVTVTARKSDMDGWTDGVAYTDLEIVQNEYSKSGTGEILPYNGWDRTGYVPCHGASSITVPPMPQEGDSRVLSNNFYDENHNRVYGMELSRTETKVLNVPSQAYYFILSSDRTALVSCLNAGVVPNA